MTATPSEGTASGRTDAQHAPGTFCVVNLGCKVNRVEADGMAASLIEAGSAPVAEEAADLIIVNTCTVTGEADKKARKAVRHALAVNSVAEVVVTGCAAAITPEVFESFDPRVRVVGKAQIENELSGGSPADQLRVGSGFRTRVGVKVQDGCDHACTYCIVHVARGKARSVSSAAIVQEAGRYFDAGVKEVVLTGIDIGAYRDGEVLLPALARMITARADRAFDGDGHPARVRISSIEPMNVTDEFIDMLAEQDGRICRHLHLPLQSGSTKVLREMDRPYTAETFLDLAAKLRDRVPQISLSTDVIVGFPGETEGEFKETCDVVRRAGFSRLHVFPYSIRQGTPAAERADQIDSEVKKRRAAELRALGRELAALDVESRRGMSELALVEGKTMLTESYHELPASPGVTVGSLVRVTHG